MFDINNIIFASATLETSGEIRSIGSIYFTNGRLRLLHPTGPKVKLDGNQEIERVTVSHADYAIVKDQGQHKDASQMYRFVQDLDSVQDVQPGLGDRLIEFFEQGRKGWHRSRGGPVIFDPDRFGLDQEILNDLVAFASRPLSSFHDDVEEAIAQKNFQFATLCESFSLSIPMDSELGDLDPKFFKTKISSNQNKSSLQSDLHMLVEQLTNLTRKLGENI